MEKKFPLYLKSSNHKNFYCILNNKEMVEVQIVGKKSFVFNINAEKYPDVMRIDELINNSENDLIKISEREFKEQLNQSNTKE